jgi:hypothetical protein
MRRAWIFLALLLLAAPPVARSQGDPLGPEFRVNTYTTGAQSRPAVAVDPAGQFVVVWSGEGQDEPSLGVFGQRFASSGTPLGPEFRVNTYTTGLQESPSVASDSAGNFVVAWASSGGYAGAPADVFGQRHASDGTPLGTEFRINTYTTSGQNDAAAASDPSGNFVVVWDGLGQDEASLGVFGQRFASSGTPLGPEFRVNTYTTDVQYAPSVAADSAGNFVVAWASSGGYGGTPADVFGQRYASDGTALGPEFQINTYTTYSQSTPAVAADPAGNFVVVWSGQGQDEPSGIFGQRFAGSGAPLGPEFRVNTYTTDVQFGPSVATDSAGNFVVAWTSSGGYGGTPPDVFGQRYASDGTPLGPEFRINSFTTNGQTRSAVGADPLGNFVVTWDSYGQDGSVAGIFGQRYGRIVPVELIRFGVE